MLEDLALQIIVCWTEMVGSVSGCYNQFVYFIKKKLSGSRFAWFEARWRRIICPLMFNILIYLLQGDSGSALVVTEDNKHGCKQSRKQAGIVSWGFPCAIGGPDMFVRNSEEMLKFIFSVTGDLCNKHQTCWYSSAICR